jgi:hypothetical protein
MEAIGRLLEYISFTRMTVLKFEKVANRTLKLELYSDANLGRIEKSGNGDDTIRD